MVKTLKVSDSKRLEVVGKYANRSVSELQAEIDRVLAKVVAETADEEDKAVASILAKVVLDRTPRGN